MYRGLLVPGWFRLSEYIESERLSNYDHSRLTVGCTFAPDRTSTRMTSQTILQPEEINPAIELANKILSQLDRILLGRTELHRLVLAGVFSRGHILLEGLPGVGKTALVKALGDLLGLEFKR